MEPLIYGDFMIPAADLKCYLEIKDTRKVVKVVEEYMEDYNNTGASQPMKLVLFLDAIEHIVRICRIIRAPFGHALLLGVGGSGRQSLTRLATFMQDYQIFQIQVSKNYAAKEWKEDLKRVLMQCGTTMSLS